MAEAEPVQNADAPSRRSGGGFLWRKLPFIAVLALAVFGVSEGKNAHYRLIGTQALHWAAILLTMNMLLWSDLRQMLPAPATRLDLAPLGEHRQCQPLSGGEGLSSANWGRYLLQS